jgi:hypothetical protein
LYIKKDLNQVQPRSNPLLYTILVVIVFGKKLDHQVKEIFVNKLYSVFIVLLLSVFVVGCKPLSPLSESETLENSDKVTFSPLNVESELQRSAKEMLKSGVVKITSNYGAGTGFVVGVYPNEAYIVTVSHVVKGDHNPNVEFHENSQKFKAQVLGSEHEPEDRGVAFLSVKGNIPDYILPFDIKTTNLYAANKVFTFGCPRREGGWAYKELHFSVQEGRYLKFGGDRVVEGYSGSPLILQVKDDYHIVGMITSITQDTTLGISGLNIIDFLQGAQHGNKILNTVWKQEREIRSEKINEKRKAEILARSKREKAERERLAKQRVEYLVRLEREKAERKRLASSNRIALVIGNADYEQAPLKNPVNDAQDMAKALAKLGFKVHLKTNVNKQVMESSFDIFEASLDREKVGLFYFSGHGVQVDRRNYILPTNNSNIHRPDDLRHKALELQSILPRMENAANMSIIILDTSRDNPYAFRDNPSLSKGRYNPFVKTGGLRIRENFSSGYFLKTGYSRGLAKMAPLYHGVFIAYATSPGYVALDGRERNSPFTKYILKFIHQQGLCIEDLFMKVRYAVMRETDGKQTPWYEASFAGEFYFAGK